jgi:hypothetical protein
MRASLRHWTTPATRGIDQQSKEVYDQRRAGRLMTMGVLAAIAAIGSFLLLLIRIAGPFVLGCIAMRRDTEFEMEIGKTSSKLVYKPRPSTDSARLSLPRATSTAKKTTVSCDQHRRHS